MCHFLFIILLSVLITRVLATQSGSQSTPTRLPKVVVRGVAVPAPSTLDTADVTRITAKDLEQQQSVTLADALRRVPGVYVTQDGGTGQRAAVSLRGASTGQTTVILDGMHINDVSADNGAVNLAPWGVDDIAEIQVIRGPFSSLYGSDAIGGVVIIETKKGKGPRKILGKAEFGSYDTYQQVVGTQGQKEQIDYQVTASRIQSAGSPTTPDRYRSQLIGKTGNPLHQENISTRLGMGHQSAHLSFFSRYTTRRLGFRSGLPIRLKPWRQNMTEYFNRLQGHFEGLEGKWSHDLGIANYINEGKNENPSGQTDGINKGSQTQADWRQSLKINENIQAQMATELAQEQFFTSRLGSPSNKARSTHGGLGGALSFRITDPLTVSTAARIDKYQNLPVVTTYRGGIEYHIFECTFKGGIGTGFKAPTLAQRFYRSPSFSGNPNLKPEKSLGWDFGVDRFFLQKRLNLGIILFQNRIRDLIVWGGSTNVNRKRARTQGFEIMAKLQVTQDWHIEATHTYTQAIDEQTKLRLERRPRNKTTLQIIGQVTPEWQVSGNILCVGTQVDFDSQNYPRKVNMPCYTLLGAETSYQMSEQWQIYGRGENILNRRYENPEGYQQTGLGLYAGLRTRW